MRPLLPSVLALTALSAASAAIPEAGAPVPPAYRSALPPMRIDTSCLGETYREEARRTRAPSPRPMATGAVTRGSSSADGASSNGYGGLMDLGGAAAPPPPAQAAMEAEAPPAKAERAPTGRGPFELEPSYPPGAIVLPPQGPSVDWGGTIHLSNDDAMSLASAQRTLWAVEQRAPLPVEHIRPHELLNYFTFDGARAAPGSMLGVTPSAFRDGDQLRFAVDVQVASPPRGPVDLTLLVDRSGSMSAEGRMSYTQRALQQAVGQLKAGDRVDLVVFDHSVCTPVRDFVVGRDSVSALTDQIGRMAPRGSTDLDAGLRSAYTLAREHVREGHAGRSGRVMVFTDAILNTGQVDADVVTEVGRALDADRIRLTGVGVGRDFRDDVLDMLTEKGRGAYVFLGSEAVVDRLFGSGFDALIHTVAEDVRFALTLPPSLGMTRFHGEESSRDAADITPVMLNAGTHQVFFSDLAIRAGRLAGQETLVFEASWTDPATGRRAGTSQSWSVDQILRGSDRTARKAAALTAWSDLLLTRAMGGEACGEGWDTFVQATRQVAGDAELAWVAEITNRQCGAVPEVPVAQWTAPAQLKLRIDSDQPIGQVALDCTDGPHRTALRSGNQVASFQVTPGSCLVTLHGTVPMVARVEVAAQGTSSTCTIRGGRLACR